MPKALLLCRSSGLYARFLLPRDVRALLGRRYLVRSLGGLRTDAARLAAARMGYALAQAIAAQRAGETRMDKKLLDAALAAHARGEVRTYDLVIPGVLSLRADGPEDHARALEAIGRVTALLPNPSQPAAPVVSKGPMLHAAITRFLADYAGTGRAEATLLETRHTLALFRDLTDDLPLAAVGHATIDAFRAALARWPARARVLPAFKDLDARGIIAKAQTLPGLPKLQVRTVEKHLDRLRVFFNDVLRRREITHNPIAGLRLQTTAEKYEPSRRAFRPDELREVFATDRRAAHGAHDPAFFWLPLFGLFLGARLEELAQLSVHDVERNAMTGVWGVHVRPHGKRRLKNAQSKRFIPLPDRLLALGLLAYVADVTARGFEVLFPGGSMTAKNGPGDRFGKWFNRTYLDAKCGLTDPQLCFHSFRNTQQTAADHLSISEAQVAPISGHAPRSIQAKHYIDPATVLERKERLDRMAASHALPELAMYRAGQFDAHFDKVKLQEQHGEAAGRRIERQTKKG